MRYFIFDIVSGVSDYPTQGVAAQSESEAYAKAIEQADGEEKLRGFKEVSQEQYESVISSW
jgi:hypothetical protein